MTKLIITDATALEEIRRWVNATRVHAAHESNKVAVLKSLDALLADALPGPGTEVVHTLSGKTQIVRAVNAIRDTERDSANCPGWSPWVTVNGTPYEAAEFAARFQVDSPALRNDPERTDDAH